MIRKIHAQPTAFALTFGAGLMLSVGTAAAQVRLFSDQCEAALSIAENCTRCGLPASALLPPSPQVLALVW